MTTPNELRLPADFESIRALGAWLEEVMAPLPSDCRERHHPQVELAVHELATNSIDHAFAGMSPGEGELVFTAQLERGELLIEVSDSGIEFDADVATRADPDLPQVRGYGLMIIETLAERLEYQRTDERNCWTAVFKLD